MPRPPLHLRRRLNALRHPAAVPATAAPDRSRSFRGRSHDRFWWHRLAATDYVPPLYAGLADEEWAVMEGWFAETGAEARIAEINVPAMSLVDGSAVTRIVQLGHYYGYSALLLGFLLRTIDQGGVNRALTEWLPGREGWTGMVLNAHARPRTDGDALVYKDACGLGLLQRVS